VVDFGQVAFPGDRGPATLTPDAAEHVGIVWPQGFLGNFIGFRDKSRGMDPDGANRVAKLGAGALVEVDVGHKAGRIATDDRQHQLQVLPHDPDHAFRAAADTDPDGHAFWPQRRIDRLILQRAAGLA